MTTEASRKTRAKKIRDAANAVRRLERQLEAAIEARDKVMIESHGLASDGMLSYEDIANATGRDDAERLSRGRVIQIVQGNSTYSKQQRRRKSA